MAAEIKWPGIDFQGYLATRPTINPGFDERWSRMGFDPFRFDAACQDMVEFGEVEGPSGTIQPDKVVHGKAWSALEAARERLREALVGRLIAAVMQREDQGPVPVPSSWWQFSRGYDSLRIGTIVDPDDEQGKPRPVFLSKSDLNKWLHPQPGKQARPADNDVVVWVAAQRELGANNDAMVESGPHTPIGPDGLKPTAKQVRAALQNPLNKRKRGPRPSRAGLTSG